MRILQVVQFFSPNHGGSAMVPYELSKHLRDAGHDVTVITTDFQMTNEFISSLDRIEVIPFHCQMNLGGFLYSPSMIKYLMCNIDKFDMVHMHNYRTYQNIIASKFAKQKAIPYVLQAHGSVMPFFQKLILKRIFDFFFGYRILDNASKVIALTTTEVEQYRKMGVNENKIAIMPNGIDLSEYDKLPDKGVFRKKYSIKDDEKIVLYLGRIHKIKGIDILVSAYSDLIKEKNNVRLVIAGPDGGFLLSLKKQIKDLSIDEKTLLIGPLYGRSKLEAYVDADVYVLPSVYDIFGNTVLEACACGTPIIVTNNCGIAEFVEKTGCVIKYDRDELKYAISKILEDDISWKDKGISGKEFVTKYFNWNNIVVKLEGIYDQIR